MKKPEEIFEYLTNHFGTEHLEFETGDIGDSWIKTATQIIKKVAKFMRDDSELLCDTLMCQSGVHYPTENALGITYHLCSTKLKHKISLKVQVPVDDPRVPSVESIWKTANWHEREAWDMTGIIFEDHPNLTRILCPDDWEGHPLRKDYVQQEFYQGITTGD